ncbi:MAG: ROK family protein [Candidatus Portnoybacteria bacterium]|nr:ROK family protein [Candidatus Portnoybacteria bacterium]MDD4982529.1 ROK family protein [Candidatus Portnoybacteria bacterium]
MYYIGFDIGASSIKAVLARDRQIIKSGVRDLPGDLENLLLALIKMHTELIAGLGHEEIGGVGFGLAGAMDLERKIMLNSPNIKYLNGQPVKELLEGRFRGHRLKIEHDAHCFLLAEKEAGLAKNMKNVFYLTLGSGIGGAFMINGQIVAGSHGAAGEAGHMIMDMEKYTGWEELGANKFIKNILGVGSAEAEQRRRGGDKKAEAAFTHLGKNLGVGIANIINIFDPEAIIINGGISATAGMLWPGIEEGVDKFVVSPAAKKTQILLSELGQFGGALGAAILVEKQGL